MPFSLNKRRSLGTSFVSPQFPTRNKVFISNPEIVEWLPIVSEETKLSHIQERLKNVAMNERNRLLILIMGVFLVGAGLIFSVVLNNSVAYVGGIFVMALGFFSTMFGFCVSVHMLVNTMTYLENCNDKNMN